jgi:predicted transcriptional regulator
LKNPEIEEIKERINHRFSNKDLTGKPVESEKEYAFENAVELVKEQYLEIELGLQQIEKGEIVDGAEFLKKIRGL